MDENKGKRHQGTTTARQAAVTSLLLILAAGAVAALAPPAWTFVAQVGSGPPAGGWVLSDLVVGSAMCLALVAVVGLALSGLATALAGDSRSGVASAGCLGCRRLATDG